MAVDDAGILAVDGQRRLVAEIDALDLSDVAPMNQPYPLANVMRDDVEQPCLDRDEVLAEAPQAEDGRFRVPPVIGIEA